VFPRHVGKNGTISRLNLRARTTFSKRNHCTCRNGIGSPGAKQLILIALPLQVGTDGSGCRALADALRLEGVAALAVALYIEQISTKTQITKQINQSIASTLSFCSCVLTRNPSLDESCVLQRYYATEFQLKRTLDFQGI